MRHRGLPLAPFLFNRNREYFLTMNVEKLIEILKEMPKDAEVATAGAVGLTSIINVISYTHHSTVFGDAEMVILENGAYPTRLPKQE